MRASALKVAGLFAGIGGLERGLAEAGHETVFACEIDPQAQAVFRQQFACDLVSDVRNVRSLPQVDLLAAGFPCQDLSQAGEKVGIAGNNSGLVEEVFRLCRGAQAPSWVLLENVSYMLRLDKGRAMAHITASFEDLGFRWAYRVVDARGFGVPQRRQRVVFLASKVGEPETVLFADSAHDPSKLHDAVGPVNPSFLYGFYWTEGLRGLGWTRDAVPTIKGGSSLGIPSPPAIWNPRTNLIGTPSIRDAERLQGFPADWTAPADGESGPRNPRWRLVGNAVCVPMAAWIGHRLRDPGQPVVEPHAMPATGWPIAAAGTRGRRVAFEVSMRAMPHRRLNLKGFLQDPLRPLSGRASYGFLERAGRAKIHFPDGLLEALGEQVELSKRAGRAIG